VSAVPRSIRRQMAPSYPAAEIQRWWNGWRWAGTTPARLWEQVSQRPMIVAYASHLSGTLKKDWP
jgi:hypothetical protein